MFQLNRRTWPSGKAGVLQETLKLTEDAESGFRAQSPTMQTVDMDNDEVDKEPFGKPVGMEELSDDKKKEVVNEHVVIVARRQGRKSRRNHRAINFLRRFSLLIVVIDLMLAVSESGLISTFFLYLTLPTTFDVKPNNAIETYCYYQPSGNAMCENFMKQASFSKPVQTHHPRIADCNDESFRLFQWYNLSFYESPAKFSLTEKVFKKKPRLSSSGNILAKDEEVVNRSEPQMTTQKGDGISSSSSPKAQGAEFAAHYVELSLPSVPTLRETIPQVSDALIRSKMKSDNFQGMSPQKIAHVKEQTSSLRSKMQQQPAYEFQKEETFLRTKSSMNLVQTKDFLRHRWKRNARNLPTGKVEFLSLSREVEDQSEGAKASSSAPVVIRRYSRDHIENSGGRGATMEEEGTKTTPRGNNNVGKTQEWYHQQPTLSPGSLSSSTRVFVEESSPTWTTDGTSTTTNSRAIRGKAFSGGDSNELFHPENDSQINMRNSLMNERKRVTGAGERSETPSGMADGKKGMHRDNDHYTSTLIPPNTQSESLDLSLSAAQDGDNLEASMNEFMSTAGKKWQSSSSQSQVKPESITTSATPSPSVRRRLASSKAFHEMNGKLEKSPRDLVSIMEATLFNIWNWKSILESREKLLKSQATTNSCSSCNDNITLTMNMKIFDPTIYEYARRKKRAVEQIYHDYGSTVMDVLKDFKEMPITRTFLYIYLGIKVYILLWHWVLSLVLLLGTVAEDKTALNIWGIFSILTSLLHFMVDEWINTNIHPVKTSACIWFGVLYGVYKPAAILIVATLSSEISFRSLRRNRGGRRMGFLIGLREIILGGYDGRWCREQNNPVGSSSNGGATGGNHNTNVVGSSRIAKSRCKRADDDDAYSNSPQPSGLYIMDPCLNCGASMKSSSRNGVVTNGEEYNDEDACSEKGKYISCQTARSFCPCSSTAKNTQGDDVMYDSTDEEDIDDESDDDGGEEEDDEDEEENEICDRDQGRRKLDERIITTGTRTSKKDTPMVVILSEGNENSARLGETSLTGTESKKVGSFDNRKDSKGQEGNGYHTKDHNDNACMRNEDEFVVVDGVNVYI